MICTKCGFQNPDGVRHCANCGSSLNAGSGVPQSVSTCPKCGHKLPVRSAKFCAFCGNPVGAADTQTGAPLFVGKAEFNKTEGEMRVFRNRIEYRPQFNKIFLILRNSIREEGTTVFDIRNIRLCYYQGHGMYLEMYTGEIVTFFLKDLSNRDLINLLVTVDSLLDHRAAKKADVTSMMDHYSFVMKIESCVEIKDMGTALVGSVKKGTVRKNAMVSVISEQNEDKGAFILREIAVKKVPADSASEGDTDVALLIFCPINYFNQGDCVCIKNTP